MIIVTDTAAVKLKEILDEEGQPEAALRVIVVPQNGGAQYMLALEEGLAEDDLLLHEEGIRVITDFDSAPLLEGAEIDYTEGLMRSGFVITNPNIETVGGSCGSGGCACGGGSCGCGGH